MPVVHGSRVPCCATPGCPPTHWTKSRSNVDRDTSHRESIIAEVLESSKAALPLYPMVLIANEVMQEGLDLHRSCRRVVHHDLAWNPAQLEQRVVASTVWARAC